MDVLHLARGSINRTGIIYRANLNSVSAKRYIDGLIGEGFLKTVHSDRYGVEYEATEEGIAKLHEIMKGYRCGVEQG